MFILAHVLKILSIWDAIRKWREDEERLEHSFTCRGLPPNAGFRPAVVLLLVWVTHCSVQVPLATSAELQKQGEHISKWTHHDIFMLQLERALIYTTSLYYTLKQFFPDEIYYFGIINDSCLLKKHHFVASSTSKAPQTLQYWSMRSLHCMQISQAVFLHPGGDTRLVVQWTSISPNCEKVMSVLSRVKISSVRNCSSTWHERSGRNDTLFFCPTNDHCCSKAHFYNPVYVGSVSCLCQANSVET